MEIPSFVVSFFLPQKAISVPLKGYTHLFYKIIGLDFDVDRRLGKILTKM